MSDSGDYCCCRCCLKFILTAGFAALFLWLSLRTSDPRFYVQDFYVPALDEQSNSSANNRNHTFYFKLKLDNPNKEKGIYYDDVNLTFSYGVDPTVRGPPIANYIVGRFYQGYNKHTYRESNLEARGVPWEEAAGAKSNGTLFFRVDLSTRVRPKIMFFYKNRRGIGVRGDIRVDETGRINVSKKKGFRLTSDAPTPVDFGVLLVSLIIGLSNLIMS